MMVIITIILVNSVNKTAKPTNLSNFRFIIRLDNISLDKQLSPRADLSDAGFHCNIMTTNGMSNRRPLEGLTRCSVQFANMNLINVLVSTSKLGLNVWLWQASDTSKVSSPSNTRSLDYRGHYETINQKDSHIRFGSWMGMPRRMSFHKLPRAWCKFVAVVKFQLKDAFN